MKKEEIKKNVRKGYAKIAKEKGSCCCGSDCLPDNISKNIGYSDSEMRSVPEGANLGLGCGNPVALASLKKGETVLDLGSGAGFDCFLAANKVGKNGKVIGLDMTPEMLEKARNNARKGGYKNVEFRMGEIENMPVKDSSVDVIISNCVINLSPDKKKVFKEAFRVLKPGGRLMVSDIVLRKELPDIIKRSVEAYVGCLSGAVLRNKYINMIKEAGFRNVEIMDEAPFPVECMLNDTTAKTVINKLKMPAEKLLETAKTVLSIKVKAVK